LISWHGEGSPKGDGQARWPVAKYEDGSLAACVTCPTSYHPTLAYHRLHAPLELYVADYGSGEQGRWRRMSRTFDCIDDLKAALPEVLARNPSLARKL